jgi:guanylate kinase
MHIKSTDHIISLLNAEGKKRIILVGKAASGKDYASKIFETLGYPYQISYTTRPMRDGEVHGKDYYFIPEYKFQDLVKMNFFYEHVSFNGWQYGTSNAQMKKSECTFIMTPSGLVHMSEEDRKSSLVVYFDIPEDIRRQRLCLRSDADSVDRRIEADRVDFSGFTNYDLIIDNPNFE